MKRFILFFILLTPGLAQTKTFTLDELNNLALKKISEVVPPEAFPQTCILKYSISQRSSSGSAHEANSQLRKKRMEVVKQLIKENPNTDLNTIMAMLESELAKTKTNTNQLTATLIYETRGIQHTETLFDLEASVEGNNEVEIFANLNSNQWYVISKLTEFGCEDSDDEAAPASMSNRPERSILNNRSGLR